MNRNLLAAKAHVLMLAVLSLALTGERWCGAATTFSDSLRNHVGSSTDESLQQQLAAGGLEFASTSPFEYRAVEMGPKGAAFGTKFLGDFGRNIIRTVATDYATVSFVAEVTVESSLLAYQDVYFGMGAGELGAFGVPDWQTPFASTWIAPVHLFNIVPPQREVAIFYGNDFVDNDAQEVYLAPGVGDGTHRLRMSFDGELRTVTYSADLNFDGGPFEADLSLGPLELAGSNVNPAAPLFGNSGWPTDPSRIFFAGDDGVVFRDFSVVVVPEPSILVAMASALLVLLRLRLASH